MEITLEEFQEAAKDRKIAPGRKPQPYNAEQRQFVLEYTRRELEAGTTKSAIVRTLGISEGTLSKWLSPDKPTTGRGFRRIQLKTESEKLDGLSLVTPGGYRIEGLSLKAAAALLASLG